MHRLRYWNIRMRAMTLWGKDLTPSLLRIQNAAKRVQLEREVKSAVGGYSRFCFWRRIRVGAGSWIQDEARFDAERDSGRSAILVGRRRDERQKGPGQFDSAGFSGRGFGDVGGREHAERGET